MPSLSSYIHQLSRYDVCGHLYPHILRGGSEVDFYMIFTCRFCHVTVAAALAPRAGSVPQMAAAFDFAEDGETLTGLGLPPVDKYTPENVGCNNGGCVVATSATTAVTDRSNAGLSLVGALGLCRATFWWR